MALDVDMLEEALRQRDELLAIVSHDLRNPLGAIDLATSLLEGRCDPGAHRQIEIIRRATRRMESMIRDLLDMASIHAGRLALDMQREDLTELVDEVIEVCGAAAELKGITLVRELCTEGTAVECDRERLAQVFANLLTNAIKFCRRGDRITVRCEHDDGSVRGVVEDTGPGIAADELPHIFEAYWSAKRYRKEGTGLGLYICKGIVEAHGGTLAVASIPDHATTFTVTLPR